MYPAASGRSSPATCDAYKTVKATCKTVKATCKMVKATYKTVQARFWPWLEPFLVGERGYPAASLDYAPEDYPRGGSGAFTLRPEP